MANLEFKEFSGGITEKSIPGTTNRYSVANNLLIDTDKKLFQRDGFGIFSNTAYQMPQVERVAKLVNFDNSSEILAFHNKKAEYISAGAWTEITGPSGNHAFNTNAASSFLSDAQWNHHLFIASNSGDQLLKLYRDDTNTLQLRTAGLPAPATPALYPDAASKLAAGIALAVDIKTQLKAHVNDFGASPAAHPVKHAAVDTALAALVLPVTLADLIAYTKVLRTQYNAHVADAKLPAAFQLYHINLSSEYILGGGTASAITNPILNIATEPKLVADGSLLTIDQVVEILNDLRNKYNWHARAPITHNNAKAGGGSWGAHFVTVAAIDLSIFKPLIAPNISTLLRYVNYLKSEYNTHALDAGAAYGFGTFYTHRTTDSRNLVEMPDATDLHEAVALLGLIEYHYSQHYLDANTILPGAGQYSSTGIQPLVRGTVTAGSPVITILSYPAYSAAINTGASISRTVEDAAAAAPPYAWLGSSAPFAPTDKVLSTVLNTSVTMDHNSGLNGTFVFAFSRGALHFDIDRDVNAKTSSSQAAKLFQEDIDLTLVDLASITNFALGTATKLKGHMLSGSVPYSAASEILNDVFAPVKNFTYHSFPAIGTAPWTTTNYVPHRFATISTSANYWPTSSALVNEIDQGQNYFEQGMLVASYSYKLMASYDYKVGTTSFTDLSSPTTPPTPDVAPTYLTVLSVVSPQTLVKGSTAARDAVNLTNLQVLANAANQNYDTANVKVQIYRTIQNGSSAYFKVGEVLNGVTTFSDTVQDTDLVNNEALYTNGGVVSNGVPPAGATYIHQASGRMYYAAARRIYVSLTDDPDSVPDSFFDELDETCTGVCSTRGNVVAFTYNTVFRMEGFFNELGQGFLRHESIFDRTGCIAPASIVQADNGIFFAGKDGFYYTDGIQCFRVSGDLSDTFIAYTNTLAKRNNIQVAYDAVKKRIYWLMQSGAGPNADVIWVMDLQFGVQANNTPVTTFTCQDAFNPTALVFFGDILHYGDADGYVFKQILNSNLDIKKNTALAATSWDVRTLLWDFKSCHSDYGSPTARKFFTRILSEFDQSTNLSVQILSDADKGRVIDSLPVIRSRKLLDWGDPKLDWIASVYAAKAGNVIDEYRRFSGSGALRSNYRAVEFKNAYCVIVNSTDMGGLTVANISAHVWSLTLTNAGTRKWPLYSVDYFVRINGVDYPVTVRTSDSVVRVDDTGLTALTAGAVAAWELWGTPKNERVRIIQYSVEFDILGTTQKAYQGTVGTGGTNG